MFKPTRFTFHVICPCQNSTPELYGISSWDFTDGYILRQCVMNKEGNSCCFSFWVSCPCLPLSEIPVWAVSHEMYVIYSWNFTEGFILSKRCIAEKISFWVICSCQISLSWPKLLNRKELHRGVSLTKTMCCKQDSILQISLVWAIAFNSMDMKEKHLAGAFMSQQFPLD